MYTVTYDFTDKEIEQMSTNIVVNHSGYHTYGHTSFVNDNGTKYSILISLCDFSNSRKTMELILKSTILCRCDASAILDNNIWPNVPEHTMFLLEPKCEEYMKIVICQVGNNISETDALVALLDNGWDVVNTVISFDTSPPVPSMNSCRLGIYASYDISDFKCTSYYQ